MCVGCSGASGVLTCAAHLFSGRGRCAVTGGRVHARATPTPKGVTALPHPLQPLLDVAHTGSQADCSPPVCTLYFSAALLSVVSDTRVQAA